MAQLQYNILDAAIQAGGKPRKIGNKILLNPCPICGHRDHFYVWPESNSYYSFSGCCNGGSLVDWLMEYEKLPLNEAMRRVHGEHFSSIEEKVKKQNQRKLVKLLTEKVESFFNAMVQRYKLFSDLENELKEFDVDNPVYRYIRQGARFYDRVTDDFINGTFEKRVQLMKEHKDEYFYKLPEVMFLE